MIKEKIEQEIKRAMIEKDDLVLSVSRLVKSAIKNAEIEKGSDLSEEESVSVIEKQAKQRRDSISQFQTAGRNDLVEKETAELAILGKYLPEKMSEPEIEKVVLAIKSSNPDIDFGRAMGLCMAELKGKADGNTVQSVVRKNWNF